MIGHVLGGRYEILDRIGGGGMALVYKGHDILLNRKVAVKVLRQQYVHDEEFIRRFRREAQAAASLSHPNVVSIYDVGQEDETHYIVMECIDGKALNETIKEKAPLPVEEAVRIASQICDALDHAHYNQIIHRDIKPHNILIGKNGRVKVTDFGIARAADSSQITQTGSVVGSVHYFSPEHAKGTLTGAQSDLYSLGIVLYQMLTNRLPFLGESPISVALKHLQEDVEEPRKVNPLIPQSVENIILKSMRKNPDERYRSAKEMLQDLDTCLEPGRRNEPKITFVSDDYDDDERTRVVPAIRSDQFVHDVEDEPDEEPRRKKRGWVKPVVWTVVILLLLALMYMGVRYVKEMLYVPDVDVPSLVGMTRENAEALLVQKQLHSRVIEEHHPDVEKDIVTKQDPNPSTVKINNTVTLYVSLGPEKQKMPDWTGKKATDVKTELAGLNITKVTLEDINSDQEIGTVVSQEPAPSVEYDPRTVAVKLKVSKGPKEFPMPQLIGETEDTAKAIATKLDLKLKVEHKPSFSQPKDRVFFQSPYKEGESVLPGAEITVSVSTGYPEDAKEATVTKQIEPTRKGVKSTIVIKYSDARGENQTWGKPVEITEAQQFNVTLVLSPGMIGTIEYYRDNDKIDYWPVPYPGEGIPGNPGNTTQQQGTPGSTTGGSGGAGNGNAANKPASTSPSGGNGSGGNAQTPAGTTTTTNSTTGGQN
ncbi:Stk1 family PASTA domain-containing Ser/Thr kinase [Paenibacillus sp. GCM10012303]|uniref:Stk1 family PASTA domain-containing Ser/Thr kinase n=1 Tax=Paenibacillus sp. GCM10012303 TaxID=3317340 RepID=UPI003622DD10